MIAIADGGSTKVDWRIIAGDQEVLSFSSKGYNPFYWKSEAVAKDLLETLPEKIDCNLLKEVHFYGSGCSDKSRCEIIENAFQKVFPNAKIVVEHDLLASARATCGINPGIACILGTGSNSCEYDGGNVSDNVTNLGFMIGDEGSGGQLGKKIVTSYFYREMPVALREKLAADYNMDKTYVLDKIYIEKSPNVYLAKFSKFCSNNKTHPFIQQLAKSAFNEFVERHVLKYKEHKTYPIHFIGSVAYHFKPILLEVIESHGLKMGMVIKKPIDNLVRFHLGQEIVQ